MRVAFISMSGVRVRTNELAELGVSLPGFVERGEVIASLPSLAGLQLAALTPEDVDFNYIDVADIDAHELDVEFDLVAFSTFTAMAYECYELAAKYRAAGVTVVIGGLHATLMPGEAMEHFDSVCVGDGELIWPRMLEDFRIGKLKSIYRASDEPLYDINEAPIPRFDLLDLEKYNRLTVQTSRGCPLDCSFCASSKIYGNFRQKSVENVLAEIDAICDIWPNPFIELADDNTFINKKWSKEFLRGMAKRNIRWFTETDIAIADDPELLDLLADSGCQQVLIGLESTNPGSLVGIDPNDWKRKRLDSYKSAISEIQSRGITVNGCFIVGLEDDTTEIFNQISDFVMESGLLECQITVLTPFPNTELHRQLESSGRLLKTDYWDRCTLFDVNYTPAKMSVAELEGGLRKLFSELYSEKATNRRRRLYMEIHKARIEAGHVRTSS
jgi:radical SAM superfamily enzyme YgiQ (UPF0313 family)